MRTVRKIRAMRKASDNNSRVGAEACPERAVTGSTDRWGRIVAMVRRFYTGVGYPLVLALLLTVGNLSGTEVVMMAVEAALLFVGMALVCSVRPVVMYACVVVLNVTPQHSPGTPSYSDYYFTGWRLGFLLAAVALTAAAVVVYAVRCRLWQYARRGGAPMLLPLCALSLGLVLNGAFSPLWEIRDTVLGLLIAAAMVVVYLLFYLGFRRESEGMLDYVIFSSAMVSAVITVQLCARYIDALRASQLQKEAINFGWGTWATAGVLLCVLIPVLFLGFLRGRGGRAAAYLALSLMTTAAAVLTLSRNAQLMGLLTLATAVVVGAFFGEHKRLCRAATAVGALLVACLLTVALLRYRAALGAAVGSFVYDNGRLALWSQAIGNFLSHPLFGSGFYGFGMDIEFIAAPFMPTVAHNYILEIMSAAGIVGLGCYLYYQVCAFLPAFRRRSLPCSMLAMSMAVLLIMSLLDNFFLYPHITLYYSLISATLSVYGARDREPKDGEHEKPNDPEASL